MLLLLILLSFLTSKPAIALEKTSSVKISASISENSVTISGYTSPQSRVELTGLNVYDTTFSGDTGYFEFNKTYLPKNYSELCLISKDNSDRTTTPICIPAPPHSKYHTNIGPVILPPTLTLDQPELKPGATVVTSGQSLPNSEIEVYFYKVNDKGQAFPKPAHAYSLPVLAAKSDSSGHFNLNLPTAYASNYRLYASVKYQDNLSPKSNTLIYKMPSFWLLFLMQNRYLLFILPLFILTLIIFISLLYLYYSPKKRYLPAISRFLPVSPSHYPKFYPENLKRSTYIPD
jgi:hypothetical protein